MSRAADVRAWMQIAACEKQWSATELAVAAWEALARPLPLGTLLQLAQEVLLQKGTNMRSLEDVHAVLQNAFELLANLRDLPSAVSPDSAFAIGEAAGTVAKAKALIGRDIDDARGADER